MYYFTCQAQKLTIYCDFNLISHLLVKKLKICSQILVALLKKPLGTVEILLISFYFLLLARKDTIRDGKNDRFGSS